MEIITIAIQFFFHSTSIGVTHCTLDFTIEFTCVPNDCVKILTDFTLDFTLASTTDFTLDFRLDCSNLTVAIAIAIEIDFIMGPNLIS